MTEKNVHVATLQSIASREQVAAYQRTLESRNARLAAAMLQRAIEVTEGPLDVDANAWSDAQQATVLALAQAEKRHALEVEQIAKRKLVESRDAIRYSVSLVVGVVLMK